MLHRVLTSTEVQPTSPSPARLLARLLGWHGCCRLPLLPVCQLAFARTAGTLERWKLEGGPLCSTTKILHRVPSHKSRSKINAKIPFSIFLAPIIRERTPYKTGGLQRLTNLLIKQVIVIEIRSFVGQLAHSARFLQPDTHCNSSSICTELELEHSNSSTLK